MNPCDCDDRCTAAGAKVTIYHPATGAPNFIFACDAHRKELAENGLLTPPAHASPGSVPELARDRPVAPRAPPPAPIPEVPAMESAPPKPACKNPGCTRTNLGARGFCVACYEYWRGHTKTPPVPGAARKDAVGDVAPPPASSPLPDALPTPVPKAHPICKNRGCLRVDIVGHGLCRRCYDFWRGRRTTPPVPDAIRQEAPKPRSRAQAAASGQDRLPAALLRAGVAPGRVRKEDADALFDEVLASRSEEARVLRAERDLGQLDLHAALLEAGFEQGRVSAEPSAALVREILRDRAAVLAQLRHQAEVVHRAFERLVGPGCVPDLVGASEFDAWIDAINERVRSRHQRFIAVDDIEEIMARASRLSEARALRDRAAQLEALAIAPRNT